MPTAARKKLPKFKSEAEEAEFWATHDSTNYWEEFQYVTEPLEIEPRLAWAIDRKARRKQLVSIRLESWQVRLARAVAVRSGVPYHTVIRNWVSRGISRTQATS